MSADRDPDCTACDPNPGFADIGMGYSVYHSCKKWKGLDALGVLRKMREQWEKDDAAREKRVVKP